VGKAACALLRDVPAPRLDAAGLGTVRAQPGSGHVLPGAAVSGPWLGWSRGGGQQPTEGGPPAGRTLDGGGLAGTGGLRAGTGERRGSRRLGWVPRSPPRLDAGGGWSGARSWDEDETGGEGTTAGAREEGEAPSPSAGLPLLHCAGGLGPASRALGCYGQGRAGQTPSLGSPRQAEAGPGSPHSAALRLRSQGERVSLAPLCVLQDEVKLPSKLSISKSLKEGEKLEKEGEGEEVPVGEDHAEEDHIQLSSDEEVEVEEIIEESRAERIKRSGMKRVDDFKKAFSKEKMEKTKLKTKENLEKTRHNLEKTRHNLEKRMNKLGTKIVTNERREKMKSSRDKLRKSFTPDHTIYARSKTAVYKVPPFTFHVKKIREGEVEVKATELVEVGGEEGENSDLLRGESPEMQTLLEITEESDAVLVDKSDSE